MKKIIYIILFGLLVTSCSSDDSPSENENPSTENPSGENDNNQSVDCSTFSISPNFIKQDIGAFPDSKNPIFILNIEIEGSANFNINYKDENPKNAVIAGIGTGSFDPFNNKTVYQQQFKPSRSALFDSRVRNKVTGKIEISTVDNKCKKEVPYELTITGAK